MRTIIPHDARLIPDNAKCVFKGVMYDVYHWPQKMYDGSTATFEMLRRVDTVKVVAVKQDKIVLIEEEQPTHQASLVLPGGRHDVATETELDCAQRELKEETGMTFKNWKLVEIKQPSSEIEWFVYLFIATDFESQTAPHHDSGEHIIIKELPFDQAKDIASTRDSFSWARDLFKKAGSLEALLALPEYT